MASTINENEDFAGGQFTPFQDTDAPRVQKAIQNFASATQGYDTQIYDQYRQGVSIKTSRHLFSTTQPKLWAGNLNHAVRVVTIGQARDFTEFENDSKFEELPEFTPDWYIQDEEYPFPIVFNNGPQQEEEAIIEPFTIPFRKANPFGNFVPRTPKASLEDGNNFENYDGGTTRVEQFIEYNQPSTKRFFLDEGVEYFGAYYQNGQLSRTEYSPLAFYPLTEPSIDTSNGRNEWQNVSTTTLPPLVDPATSVVDLRTGPWTSSKVNPRVANFELEKLTASYVAPELQITGSMSAMIFFLWEASSSKILFTVDGPDSGAHDNILWQLQLLGATNTLQYLVEHGTGSFTNSFLNASYSNSQWQSGSWQQAAFVRTSISGGVSSSVKVYLNGELLDTADLTSPNSGLSSSLAVGGANGTGGNMQGGMTQFKVWDRAITDEQVAAEYNTFKTEALALDGAISIDGYVAFIQRDADPFDDTRDEQIVEQITTTDATFIGRLKELDFDLSEDIRGTFDKKSAAAGGDVYGPDSARYGTDSIAYRGLIRGS